MTVKESPKETKLQNKRKNVHTTFVHLRGEWSQIFCRKENTLMQGMNGLEKKICLYKLVAKTSEPEIEQKYLWNTICPQLRM